MKKTFILLISLLMIPVVFHGQDKPEFKPTYYKDTVTGKLYWNKALPAYLTISPTPDPGSGVQLESKKTKQYADPFYFDTEGINYVRTRWAVDKKTMKTVPNVEIVWEVYADSRPPQTHIHLLDKYKHLVNDTLYCGKDLKVAFSSDDALSGVKVIYYSVNGQNYKPFADTFSITGEGSFEIKYFAVDNVNNTEKTHRITFVTDFTAPHTEAVVTGIHLGRENIISTNTNIYLQPSDKVSGLKATYFRIDSAAWKLYTPRTSIPIAYLDDGRHILEFYSVDNVGNKEPVQQFKFYLDKTAPITIADVLGDKFIVNGKIYFSGRTKMKLTSVDNKSGVKAVFYSIDGSPFKKYTEPFYLPSNAGWHNITYFAVDSTENVTLDKLTQKYFQYRMKVDKVYMDLTGPTVHFQILGNKYLRSDTIFISPVTKIQLAAHDAESGVKGISYYLDNEKIEKDYTGPFTLAQYPAGLHRLIVSAYDNVNNRNEKSFDLFLDKDAPKILYSFDISPLGQRDSLPVYAPNTKLFLSFVDDYTGTSKIFYSLNNGQKIPYKNYITGFPEGLNTVRIEVEDKVGNKATKTIKFYVK